MNKEILSKFNEKPKTKLAWWGMGLGLSTLVMSQLLLGLYASINSFSQLTAKTSQRKEPLRQWPPRAGQAILL